MSEKWTSARTVYRMIAATGLPPSEFDEFLGWAGDRGKIYITGIGHINITSFPKSNSDVAVAATKRERVAAHFWTHFCRVHRSEFATRYVDWHDGRLVFSLRTDSQLIQQRWEALLFEVTSLDVAIAELRASRGSQQLLVSELQGWIVDSKHTNSKKAWTDIKAQYCDRIKHAQFMAQWMEMHPDAKRGRPRKSSNRN